MVDINLYGFNTDVSDLSIKDLSKAIGKLSSLTELDLNFDRQNLFSDLLITIELFEGGVTRITSLKTKAL